MASFRVNGYPMFQLYLKLKMIFDGFKIRLELGNWPMPNAAYIDRHARQDAIDPATRRQYLMCGAVIMNGTYVVH